MINNVEIWYLIGFAFFVVGSIRHLSSLGVLENVSEEHFSTDYPGKRWKTFVLSMPIPLMIGGAVKFHWWSPFLGFTGAFLIAIVMVVLVRTEDTKFVNRLFISLGFLLAGGACLAV
jgi:hypothetical protein